MQNKLFIPGHAVKKICRGCKNGDRRQNAGNTSQLAVSCENIDNLNFYIEAVTQKTLKASPNKHTHGNISKEEMSSLRSLSQDDSIFIKKAVKSNIKVIMNREDYIKEVERHLDNKQYYTKVNCDPSESIKQNIQNCVNEIYGANNNNKDKFDMFPETIRIPQFYI